MAATNTPVPAADSQLIEQGLRHVESRARDDDGIERRGCRQAETAVAIVQPDVRHAQRPKIELGALGKRAHPLDRINLGCDLRQHRRLIAAAGPDLQHLVEGAPGRDQFDHARNH